MSKINTEELYNHILKNMTAEQALKNILEAQIINYTHLKFNNGEEIHPVMVICMAALEMGWDLAIPNHENEEDEIKGLSCGKTEYLNELFPDEKMGE